MTGMQRCRRPVGETPLQRKFGFLISTCAHSSQRCLTSPERLVLLQRLKVFGQHSFCQCFSGFFYCMCLHCANELPQQLQFISRNQLVPLCRNVHAETNTTNTFLSHPFVMSQREFIPLSDWSCHPRPGCLFRPLRQPCGCLLGPFPNIRKTQQGISFRRKDVGGCKQKANYAVV